MKDSKHFNLSSGERDPGEASSLSARLWNSSIFYPFFNQQRLLVLKGRGRHKGKGTRQQGKNLRSQGEPVSEAKKRIPKESSARNNGFCLLQCSEWTSPCWAISLLSSWTPCSLSLCLTLLPLTQYISLTSCLHWRVGERPTKAMAQNFCHWSIRRMAKYSHWLGIPLNTHYPIQLLYLPSAPRRHSLLLAPKHARKKCPQVSLAPGISCLTLPLVSDLLSYWL